LGINVAKAWVKCAILKKKIHLRKKIKFWPELLPIANFEKFSRKKFEKNKFWLKLWLKIYCKKILITKNKNIAKKL